MLDVLPLSPVREWAISRSFISAHHIFDGRADEIARHISREDADHLTCGLGDTSAAGGAVRVKGLHLVADPYRLGEAARTSSHPRADLVRLVAASVRGELAAVNGIDTN